MALGSAPVGVGPGKPTTDSGGKSEELTAAAVELVSYTPRRCTTRWNVLPDGGYTSLLGEPASGDALTVVVGAASASAANAITTADRKCILNRKCPNQAGQASSSFRPAPRGPCLYLYPRQHALSCMSFTRKSSKLDKLVLMLGTDAARLPPIGQSEMKSPARVAFVMIADIPARS